jgi:hypothetical protein
LIAGIEQADPTGMGLTTKEIQRKTFGSQGDFEENEALAEAVFEICGEHFNGKQFGRRVRGLVERPHGGKFIDAVPARGGVCRWRVRPVHDGFGGFGGSISTQSDSKPRAPQDLDGGFGGFGGLNSPGSDSRRVASHGYGSAVEL